MKKIFTLFTAALAALSVNAQDWNATNSGPLAKGATILDNEYVTVVTAVQDSETALIKNETDQNDPKTYAGFTFTKYVNIRVTDARRGQQLGGYRVCRCHSFRHFAHRDC